jgi:hypothetical protein
MTGCANAQIGDGYDAPNPENPHGLSGPVA